MLKVIFNKDQNKQLSRVKNFAQDFYQRSEKSGDLSDGGHGFDHAQRVTGLAAYLAKLEKVDPFLPVISALIHDLGRVANDPRSKNSFHGQLSREIVKDFISQLLDGKNLEIVLNAVEDHPFLNEKVRQTQTVKILMDADRLDAFGMLAPVRSAMTKWRLPIYQKNLNSSTADHNVESIYTDFGVRIPEWYDMFWTKSARKIATPRLKFLKNFNKKFIQEIELSMGYFESLNL